MAERQNPIIGNQNLIVSGVRKNLRPTKAEWNVINLVDIISFNNKNCHS